MKNESSFVQTVQTLDHHNHNEPRAHTLYIQSRFLHWNPYKKALTKHTISISRVRSFLTEKLIGLTVCLKLYNVLFLRVSSSRFVSCFFSMFSFYFSSSFFWSCLFKFWFTKSIFWSIDVMTTAIATFLTLLEAVLLSYTNKHST